MTSVQLGKLNIIFEESVLAVFNSFKQMNWRQREAGGILLGRVSKNRKTVTITKASVPTRYDSRAAYQFVRHKDVAQIIIDYEFYNSGGTIIYLGEWHTHAQKRPTPSAQDLRMLQEQYLANDLNESLLIVLIKGIEQSYVGMILNGEYYECHLLL